MKKIIFYIALLLSLLLVLNITQIIVLDWNSLTEFGAGYLIGNGLLLLVFLLLAFFTRKRKSS